MQLDRTRPFGTVSPPLMEEDFDRPAHYEQDGKLFDAHDRLIIPGEPLPGQAPKKVEAEAVEVVSVSELLATVDSTPWFKWLKQAKAVLGPTCPAGKSSILEALREAQAAYTARQEKRTQQAPEPASSMPGQVDLVAWGQGRVNYIFSEVRKAIQQRFNTVCTTTHDAVDVLISQGVVTAAHARKDA